MRSWIRNGENELTFILEMVSEFEVQQCGTI